MRFAAHSTEDPGGKPDGEDSPKFHGDLPHRPFVAITNSNIPKVQIVPEIVFPFQSEALTRIKRVLNKAQTVGTNGHTRAVAMNGGLLQYPPGPQPEGTPVRLYPILFTDPENVEAVEDNFVSNLRHEIASEVEGAVFSRFVGHPKDVIYQLEKERAQREHAIRMGMPHLYIADEATDSSAPGDTAAEIHHDNLEAGDGNDGSAKEERVDSNA